MWYLRAVTRPALLLLMAQACSSGVAAAPDNHSPTPVAVMSPSPSPSETPTPAAARNAISLPTSVTVYFSRLPSGTYPVHVHSRCSGSRTFHIVVVQSLQVGAGGSGAIQVPSGYFGRGLCLMVYSDPSLSAVLTTRPV